MFHLNAFSLVYFLAIVGIATAFQVISVSDEAVTDSMKSDLNETDVQDALNLDVGEYTTTSFQYTNDQNVAMVKNRTEKHERCYDDHIKCLLSMHSAPHPVCAYHDLKKPDPEFFRIFRSYCDVYMDNCIREYRFWIILTEGTCYLSLEGRTVYYGVLFHS